MVHLASGMETYLAAEGVVQSIDVAGLGVQELLVIAGIVGLIAILARAMSRPATSPRASIVAPVSTAPPATTGVTIGRAPGACACGSANPANSAFCGACGLPLGLSCDACGRHRDGDESFCRNCGMALVGAPPRTATSVAGAPPARPEHVRYPTVPATVVASADRQRPTWVIWALMLLSLGSYLLVWFGQSWSELKKVARDPGMSPFWHALTLAVPLYNLFRIHAHFRTIREQRAVVGLPPSLAPGLAVAAAILGSAAFTVSNRLDRLILANSYRYSPADIVGVEIVSTIIALVGAIITGAVVAAGQRGLNGIWATAGSPHRASAGEWVAILILAALWGLVILGYIDYLGTPV